MPTAKTRPVGATMGPWPDLRAYAQQPARGPTKGEGEGVVVRVVVVVVGVVSVVVVVVGVGGGHGCCRCGGSGGGCGCCGCCGCGGGGGGWGGCCVDGGGCGCVYFGTIQSWAQGKQGQSAGMLSRCKGDARKKAEHLFV